jgi:hypothetical protein
LARGIKKIHDYLTENRHTNIMCVNVPVRYDLSELSFIKEELRTFNRIEFPVSTSTRTS